MCHSFGLHLSRVLLFAMEHKVKNYTRIPYSLVILVSNWWGVVGGYEGAPRGSGGHGMET